MNTTSLSERLARAEAYVISGQRRLARQKQLIEILRAGGRDTRRAESVLERLIHTHALNVGELRRVRGVLARHHNASAPVAAAPAVALPGSAA
jgi:hypothetical protein